jgi:hypothetical protein
MFQHIPGQWEMEECTLDGKALTLDNGFTKKDAGTLKFEIELPARTEKGPATKELTMHYHQRNVRPDRPVPVVGPQPMMR